MRIPPTNSTPDSWVRIVQPRPLAPMRLFCFPYAGGGASVFRAWASELPKDVEVCAIQLPGRENRLLHEPYTDIRAIARALASALVPFLDRPYAFFGHSMGSLVAFELARELRRRSQRGPDHLIASGHRAPQLTSRRQPIHDLPQDAFLDALRRLNGTPEEVLRDPELMALVLPTLRGDFGLCERYAYGPDEPLDCPISAFGGLHDPDVGHDDLSGWREQTRAGFAQRMFPGDHFYLRDGAAKALLQRAICKDLGLAGGRATVGPR
jgi:medium-chain acyl-[acyl-carrier-protein] hydrolase